MYVSESQIVKYEDTDDQEQQFHLTPDLLSLSTTIPQEDSPSSRQRNTTSPAIATPFTDTQQNNSFITPGPMSPASSTSSISSDPQHRPKKRTRQDSEEDDFLKAINNVADALRQPTVVTNNLNARCSSEDQAVNGFLSFIGSLLQSFHDEELKLQVMNTVTQTVLNAKTLDLERAKK